MAAALEVLLFDLGGVLVRLEQQPIPRHWLGSGDSPEAMAERCFRAEAVRAFESGELGCAGFAQALIAEAGIQASADEVLAFFRDWPQLDPATPALLKAIPRHYRRACFSNTNPLHWPRLMEEMALAEAFETCFASFQLGVMKPHAAAYDQVIGGLGCTPESILFLDDTWANVAAARAAGMQAECVHGIEAVRGALLDYGVALAPDCSP